ncbi:chemotaxis protein methyltransferase CheR [Caulobacter ginsengisoli]|uniref:histidine kinase n=1 Tax=Caulobacter ginsengisoli TaxID=400775 RepID=A0ABU0IZ69_9CAUL|nr:histidine kinase dimerization/phosphoacceptor domain -containing protein [Caulobacter ginsengisoli]MDQ0466591.1 chemotaxis protein methyltransferase CheR [Caulobacter ginsengisoli]
MTLKAATISRLRGIAEAQTLAEAIVHTLHEPFLVLDAQLRVLAASRAFHETFQVEAAQTEGRLLYDLGDGQWNIPALRLLLETIIPEQAAMDGFEVDHEFPGLGRRIMMLNARKVIYETIADTTILLAFTDITDRRIVELEKDELLARTEDLLRQKRVLLQEMEHRVANSLQIIASILMLKARAVSSDESRQHLRDAHQRVMSVAAVQSHLHATEGIDLIAVAPYLEKLCASLVASMIGEDRPIAIRVIADDGKIGSAQAISIGLIVTELVINAIKYAFPQASPDSVIEVIYRSEGDDWALAVADNGVGLAAVGAGGGGLGTVIVQALVKQLGARLETRNDAAGMQVSITHAAA